MKNLMEHKRKYIINAYNKQGRFVTVYEEPPVKEGDSVIVEDYSNKYDLLAQKFLIPYYFHNGTARVITVPSSHIRLTVEEVEESWTLKEGLSGSWLTHGDYSNNPNFRRVWRVYINMEHMEYDLVDFLNLLLKENR